MDASDLLVTKSGGLTTAEALNKHLPVVVVDPIPGQRPTTHSTSSSREPERSR
jgi:UDP-N-acetylglucosamine:LPS N-acetylglucosamine transferase